MSRLNLRSKHPLAALALGAALLACNRPPLLADDDTFGTSGELPEGADVDPSCGDGLSQEGEFCLVLIASPLAGIDPCDLDTADFNEDGRPDLAVPNSDPSITNNSYVANILMGDGTGMSPAAAFEAGGAVPVRSAAGDFNGDGHADFAVSNYTEQRINILLGDGSGNMVRAPELACGATTGDLAAGDVDGDGRDELLVVLDNNTVRVYFGGQHNAFETIFLSSGALDVETGDFNGDGIDEIIIPRSAAGSFDDLDIHARAPGPPGGASYALRWALSAGASTVAAKAGDLDDDSDLDLVALDANGQIRIYENQGGELTFAHTQTFGGSFRDLVIEDFDAMARKDLAITDMVSNHVRFFRLGSDDQYYEFASRFTGNYPVAAVSADFNDDGLPDLATADQFSDRVSIFVSMP